MWGTTKRAKEVGEEEDNTFGKRRRLEGSGARGKKGKRTAKEDGSKVAEADGLEGAKKAIGTVAMDDLGGEDAFEVLGEELEQGTWDARVAESDGLGGGMDKSLADGNVAVGPGFEALAQLYHRGGHGIAQCDTTGLRGEWQEELEGSLQLEQIGNKEWEASMRAQRRKGVDEKPRKYAWDQEDFDQVDMTMGAAGEESREEGEGSGAIRL